jgi:hypothetical protein
MAKVAQSLLRDEFGSGRMRKKIDSAELLQCFFQVAMALAAISDGGGESYNAGAPLLADRVWSRWQRR